MSTHYHVSSAISKRQRNCKCDKQHGVYSEAEGKHVLPVCIYVGKKMQGAISRPESRWPCKAHHTSGSAQ